MISVLLGLAVCLAPVTFTLAPMVFTTGCASVSNVDTNTINTTAIILRGAARDGAVIAMQENPETKKYFQLASQVLSTFITGKDYTPGAFQTALLNINVEELNNPWVQIGIGTVIDLYQLYFGQYIKGQVNGDLIAQAFITAVQDGFNMALGQPVSPTKKYFSRYGGFSAQPPMPFGTTGGVLPRPVKK